MATLGVLLGACGRQSDDSLAELGRRWDQDEVRRLAVRGRAAVATRTRVPSTIRLDDPAQLVVLEEGTVPEAGGREIDVDAGTTAFAADGSGWGVREPSLIWSYREEERRLARDQDFGGVEVRVRNKRAGDHTFLIHMPRAGGGLTTTVPLVAERTMNYVIEPDMATIHDLPQAPDRDSLTLVFPGVRDRDDLEILTVKIRNKRAAYLVSSLGKTYETLEFETRPVLYQWSGGSFGREVRLPVAGATVRFGMALLPESTPATFTLSVELDGARHEIFRETVERGDVWHDRESSLAAWQGTSGRLVFEVEAEAPVIGLWSSPRIVETGRAGKLVVVYLIDALRPDFCEGLGSYRGRPNSTPAIRGLIEDGVAFPLALANAPLTKYSMSALFSGLYPLHTGIMTSQRVPDEIETVAETLRGEGFLTASFLANLNAGRLRGLHQGFDHSFDMARLRREAARRLTGDPGDMRADLQEVTSRAVIGDFLFDFLRRHRNEDLFVFLHLMDPHTPYLPDRDFLGGFQRWMEEQGLPVPADRVELRRQLLEQRDVQNAEPVEGVDKRFPDEAMLELYRGAVESADRHLGRFLDFLEREERLPATTLVLTADHGEHLTEHPEAGSFIHMHPMFLEVLRVPLVFYAPGRLPAGRRVTTPVQLADVTPTLLDLAGIDYDAARFDGVSMALLLAGESDDYFEKRPIVSQSLPYWSVFAQDLHSPHFTSRWPPAVYRFAEDPHEHRPLAGVEARTARQLLRRSLGFAAKRPVPASGTLIASPKALDQLRALGYVN